MLIGYTFNGVVGVDRAKGDTPRDTVVEVYLYDGNTYGAMPLTKKMTLTVDIGNKNRCDVARRAGDVQPADIAYQRLEAERPRDVPVPVRPEEGRRLPNERMGDPHEGTQ